MLIVILALLLALACSGSELEKVTFQSTNKLISPISKTVCVYYEATLFLPDGSSIGIAKSEDDFFFVSGKDKIRLQNPPARLYLKPVFEKIYHERELPIEIRKLIVNEYEDGDVPDKFTIKEWCLLPKKLYWIETIKETFHLPGPNVDYEEKSYNTFRIMDYKYNSKERDKYLTPRSNWTGG